MSEEDILTFRGLGTNTNRRSRTCKEKYKSFSSLRYVGSPIRLETETPFPYYIATQPTLERHPLGTTYIIPLQFILSVAELQVLSVTQVVNMRMSPSASITRRTHISLILQSPSWRCGRDMSITIILLSNARQVNSCPRNNGTSMYIVPQHSSMDV